MPNLVRIYQAEFPSEDAPASSAGLVTTSKRERRLYLAFFALTSVNVLIVSGLATFTALVLKH